MRFSILILMMAASPVLAGQKIPLTAAIAQCEKHSLRYSRTIADGGGNAPSQDKIDQRYRSCVYAKSGSYPPSERRKAGIRVSGSLALGIVVKK